MPHRCVFVVRLVALALVAAGCEAAYDDLRPADVRARDLAFFVDGGPSQASADGGGSSATDAGAMPFDAGDVAAPDGGPGPDGGPAPDGGADPEPTVLARGVFGGRTGYTASGGAALVRDPDGALFLDLADDFRVQGVPGPIVMLSTRDRIGREIDTGAGDVELGILRSNAGAQRYAVPEGAADARFAWVYCRPFRVEVAVARLEAAP